MMIADMTKSAQAETGKMQTLVAARAGVRSALAHWFGLTKGAAAILEMLYVTRLPMTADDLAHATQAQVGSVSRVHMVVIRKSLCDDAIDHIPGKGYLLTEAGVEECRAALIALGDELRGAA